MLAGDLYVAADSDNDESVRIHERAVRLLEAYRLQFTAGDHASARATLAAVLGSVGAGVAIRPPLFVDYGENLHVGARTFINYQLTALDVAAIRIGEDCQIGPGVQLLTPTHPIDPGPRRDKLEAARPITIGDNVWLGGGVIVCPGVSIGDNSVIGAGSVVTKDVPANVVCVGNPARVIREIG
ncbi:sugar O-acetyltransferase [Kineosporia mesophila]|nr:sugar O-acetyltransferase [Kineosporia mesophila]